MKFIHTADIHLGAEPDAGSSYTAKRPEELWNSFERLLNICEEEQTDLLLIAGDLFHRQPLPQELKEVSYLFSTIPQTRVVLMAGNHDYLRPDSAYLSTAWSRNVACLFSRECECVRFPEIGTEVYGLSYYRQEIPESLYDGLHPVDSDCFQVLLAHGGDALHIPFRKEKLARSGFDYVALGHIHKPQELAENRVVYAGALSPIDCGDTGPHGYVLGTWERGKVTVELCPGQKGSMPALC